MTIAVFTAHPDDLALGAGGTIAKYAQEGERVIAVVFSYGEGSDPLLDPKQLTEKKFKEVRRAADILGVKDLIFLGLADSKFSEQAKRPETIKKIKELLNKYRPSLIITHAIDDMLPARRDAGIAVKEILKELDFKPRVYTFAISTPLRFKQRRQPRIYIDISNTFSLKKKALEVFKTQRKFLVFYSPFIYLQNWFAGFKARCHYAEVFYRL